MTTLIIFYGLGCGLTVAVCRACLVVTRRECDEKILNSSLRGNKGEQFADFAGAIALIAAISELFWGIFCIKVYIGVLAGFFGLSLSSGLMMILIKKNKVPTFELIQLGPPVLVFINALLWFFKR